MAAHDISLNISKGELIALLGPSGCGKTTTLRMIAGFVQPTSGEVIIDGKDVTRLAPHKRNIGVVFQSYALFPHLTVLGNVAFGLSMRAVSKDERNERARAALDLVGLGRFADRYPGQLSGGQQQRVALARALVIEPSVLLLDEPLSNLDAHLRGEMRSEIRALQQRLSITTVFVTHDQAEALAMADRVVVMNAGEIVEIGAPRDLCDNPRHAFTASFLGERAVIEGATAGDIFTAPGFHWQGAPAGSTRAVLRAARLRFDPNAGPKVLEGTVIASAYLGDAVETDVATASGRVRLLTPSDQPVPPVGASCAVHALPGSVTFI
ncbi:Fe(3+) ions import ATP-binding protein fbpC [Ketogulonicigenium vulgare Y25]|nr:Fe(3+) ions import ATP-binding protein fbpC [Ketogulonicigenium vulgare Y25]AOZ53081.1 Fe(3+) ions import ATP-binding protein fbpC [Ketogulonicigenium vulgare]